MKVILLVLLLTGCATSVPETVQPAADVQLCALQVVKVMSETLFVARMHCEPDGVKS